MPKVYILWSYQITFSGITAANRNRLGPNFTGRRRVTWHVLLQTFSALRQTGAKLRRKKHFLWTFCHQNNTSFHPLPGGRFPWNLNTKRESRSSIAMNSCGTIFFGKGHFLLKPHFRRGAPALALGESEHCTLWSNCKDVCIPSDFFHTTFEI